MYFGTDLHKLLELRNDPKALKEAKETIKDTFYSMPAAWQTDLGETYVEDLFTIFKDYKKVYKYVRQPQIMEREFEFEVGSYKGEPIIFVGKIDELYLLKHHGVKSITVGEHKTFTNKPFMDTLIMNPQKCLYAKAVQFLYGFLPDKVKWDYIKSTPSAEPIWLEKSGRFSDASSTKITPMSWRRACKSRGILDPEILHKGERYRGNIPEFFFQVELDIDPILVDTIWEGFIFTAKQLVRYGEKNQTRNMGRDCAWCDYRDICYAEMTGGDVEYVVGRDYKERESQNN